MPRGTRRKSESKIYHIILRGQNRQIIFEEDEDKEKFIQTLKDVKVKSNCKIYAYCLMGNQAPDMSTDTIVPVFISFKIICLLHMQG